MIIICAFFPFPIFFNAIPYLCILWLSGFKVGSLSGSNGGTGVIDLKHG